MSRPRERVSFRFRLIYTPKKASFDWDYKTAFTEYLLLI